MLNQIVLVGRLVDKPLVEENNEERKYSSITLAVPRSFKNSDGNYDTDFIECTLFGQVAESTHKYCNKGDIVGVKGRIARLSSDKSMSIIAEKVTFLSTKKEEN